MPDLRRTTQAPERDFHPETDEGQASRKRRLKAINAFLKERDLKPFARLGSWKQGEIELVRAIPAVFQNPWYSIVGFDVLKPPNGEAGTFHLRFHAAGGSLAPMIVVPEVNETHLAFSREYRVACTGWFTEFPRAFAVSQGLRTVFEQRLHRLAHATPLGRERPYEALPLCVLARKVSQLVGLPSLQITGIELTPQGLAHDTGFDTADAELWIVRMRADPEELARVKGTDLVGIRLHTLAEAIEQAEHLGIRDAMTEAALLRYVKSAQRIRLT